MRYIIMFHFRRDYRKQGNYQITCQIDLNVSAIFTISLIPYNISHLPRPTTFPNYLQPCKHKVIALLGEAYSIC